MFHQTLQYLLSTSHQHASNASPSCLPTLTPRFGHPPVTHAPAGLASAITNDDLHLDLFNLQQADRFWRDHAIIGHAEPFLPPDEALKEMILAAWRTDGEIKHIGRNCVLFLFHSESDMLKAMLGSPYNFQPQNIRLHLRKYDPSFSTFLPQPRVLPIWISFRDLPLPCWNTVSIRELASRIGPVLGLHPHTEKGETLEEAFVLIQYTVGAERPPWFWVRIGSQSRYVPISYYDHLSFCMQCMSQEHRLAACPLATPPLPPVSSNQQADHNGNNDEGGAANPPFPPPPPHQPEDENFGAPLMQDQGNLEHVPLIDNPHHLPNGFFQAFEPANLTPDPFPSLSGVTSTPSPAAHSSSAWVDQFLRENTKGEKITCSSSTAPTHSLKPPLPQTNDGPMINQTQNTQPDKHQSPTTEPTPPHQPPSCSLHGKGKSPTIPQQSDTTNPNINNQAGNNVNISSTYYFAANTVRTVLSSLNDFDHLNSSLPTSPTSNPPHPALTSSPTTASTTKSSEPEQSPPTDFHPGTSTQPTPKRRYAARKSKSSTIPQLEATKKRAPRPRQLRVSLRIESFTEPPIKTAAPPTSSYAINNSTVKGIPSSSKQRTSSSSTLPTTT